MLQTRQDYASLLRLCAFILTKIGNKGAMLLQKPPVDVLSNNLQLNKQPFQLSLTHKSHRQDGDVSTQYMPFIFLL